MKGINDWKATLGALIPEGYEPEHSEPEKQTDKASVCPKLKVELDKKRSGKTATIIHGFDSDDERVSEIAATLKRKLAVGGSARGGEILLQGDRVEQAKELLRAMGYKA